MMNAGGAEQSYSKLRRKAKSGMLPQTWADKARERDTLIMLAHKKLKLTVRETSLLTGLHERTIYTKFAAMRKRGEELLQGSDRGD